MEGFEMPEGMDPMELMAKIVAHRCSNYKRLRLMTLDEKKLHTAFMKAQEKLKKAVFELRHHEKRLEVEIESATTFLGRQFKYEPQEGGEVAIHIHKCGESEHGG